MIRRTQNPGRPGQLSTVEKPYPPTTADRKDHLLSPAHRTGRMLAALLAVVAALLLAGPVFAAAGGLDATFDTDGKVTTSFGQTPSSANALAIQKDGRLVAAGTFNNDFALARYNPDGSPDPTFGGGDGQVFTTFTDFANARDEAVAVAVLLDGRIIAAGTTSPISSNLQPRFVLARYNPDGSLDKGFGGDGMVTTDFRGPSTTEEANAVAVQSDGGIIAAGSTGGDFALARYNPDGSPDTTFDGDGEATTSVSSGEDIVNALALQPDGRIVVAGRASGDFALARYDTSGALDASFERDGLAITDFGGASFEEANALVLQPDGRIVAAGRGPDDFALARYDANGSLDTGFGAGGKVTTSVTPVFDEARALALQPDGRLVTAGLTLNVFGTGFESTFALARLNADGSPDTSFGVDGTLTTDFGSGRDRADALAVQSDGKIVAAGASGPDFALARYISADDQSPPETTITSAPQSPSNSTTATFAFSSSEPGSNFRCSLDGGPFTACSSPRDLSGLADGPHVFRAKALDAAGNVDPTPASHDWKVDTKKPAVTEVVPAGAAAGVSVSQNVLAFFSEPMRPESLNTATFKLRKAGTTTIVTSAVTYQAAKQRATLNPEADLKRGATYVAVVTVGAKDEAGNRLAAARTWRFTVGE